MNFYQRHIGDYLKDTSHLSLLEHGIYARLLDVYYTRESGIPDDQAARLIGARGAEVKSMKAVLGEFFRLVDGIWTQGRCDAEIVKYQAKSEQAKYAASLSVEARQRKADAERTMSGRSTENERTPNVPRYQIPDTNNQIPEQQKREVDKPPSRPKFCKPTIPEIRAYCEQIGATINPSTFFNHYETVGWKVGKNQMRDWQAAVRGWNSRDAK